MKNTSALGAKVGPWVLAVGAALTTFSQCGGTGDNNKGTGEENNEENNEETDRDKEKAKRLANVITALEATAKTCKDNLPAWFIDSNNGAGALQKKASIENKKVSNKKDLENLRSSLGQAAQAMNDANKDLTFTKLLIGGPLQQALLGLQDNNNGRQIYPDAHALRVAMGTVWNAVLRERKARETVVAFDQSTCKITSENIKNFSAERERAWTGFWQKHKDGGFEDRIDTIEAELKLNTTYNSAASRFVAVMRAYVVLQQRIGEYHGVAEYDEAFFKAVYEQHVADWQAVEGVYTMMLLMIGS